MSLWDELVAAATGPETAQAPPQDDGAAQAPIGLWAALQAATEAQDTTVPLRGPEEGDVLTQAKAIELGLDETQEIEGGFVDNPADRGGPTNRGVTLSTLQRVRPGATLADLKKLDHAGAREIFRKAYVEEPGLDKLPPQLLPHMVGLSIHAGPQRAIKLLQEAAGVTADGRLGPATLAAARRLNVDALREKVEDFYVGLAKRDPSQLQFLQGWLRRARRLHRVTGQVVTEQPQGRPAPDAHKVGNFVEVYEGNDGKLYTMDLEGNLKPYEASNGG